MAGENPQAAETDPWEASFGAYRQALVDLNGDGVPDARVRLAENTADPEDVARRARDMAISKSRNERIVKSVGDLQHTYPGMMEDARQKALQRLGRQDQPPVVDMNPMLQEAAPQADQGGRNIIQRGIDRVGEGAALLDYYTGGIPSTMAGLVNAAIPGQPLGGVAEAQEAARRARADLAQSSLGRDLLAMPEAFAGSGPGTLRGIPTQAGYGPKNPMLDVAPPTRGPMQGVPNVYQRPTPYVANEIKSPQGPLPPDAQMPTGRTPGVEFYTDLYGQDAPGTAGRALIERVGSNRIKQPMFTDTGKYAPYSLAEIKARVAAGDAEALAEYERLAAEEQRLAEKAKAKSQPPVPPGKEPQK